MPSYTHAWLVVIFVTREWSNCLVHNKIVFKHRKLTFGPFFFFACFGFCNINLCIEEVEERSVDNLARGDFDCLEDEK